MSDTTEVPNELLRELKKLCDGRSGFSEYLPAVEALAALAPPPKKRPTEAAITAYCEQREWDPECFDDRASAGDILTLLAQPTSEFPRGLLRDECLEDDE